MKNKGFFLRFIKWLYPGIGVKRWTVLAFLGALIIGAGAAIANQYQVIWLIEKLGLNLVRVIVGESSPLMVGGILIVVGLGLIVWALRNLFHGLISPISYDQYRFIDIVFNKKHLSKGPKIVVIGGGTGLSVLLRGLKEYTSNITAIVTVADDGGSSGRLRGELGILPPGDIRNCMVALADTETLMEKLFQYRFDDSKSTLAGHSLGNLLLAGMIQITGSMDQAIREISKVLAMRGQVLPSTLKDVKLVAELEDGTEIKGESQIPKAQSPIKKVRLEPNDAQTVPEAISAINNADAIILGPGSLYTSILPNLLIKDITQALLETDAIKIYICNVMSQPGETDNYTAARHVKALIDHVGQGVVDYALVNTETVPKTLLTKYALKNQKPVEADLEKIEAMGVIPIAQKLIYYSDLVRHHPQKLSKSIISLIFSVCEQAEKRSIFDFYLFNKKTKQGQE